MIGALGPDRRHEFHLDANKELFDPETNAKAAFAISGKGDSFQPWTTYTSGAYKSHLDEARKGVKAMQHNDDATHPASSGGKHPAGHGGKEGGKHGGGGDGFMVDPDALSGYAKSTRTIADELDRAAHQGAAQGPLHRRRQLRRASARRPVSPTRSTASASRCSARFAAPGRTRTRSPARCPRPRSTTATRTPTSPTTCCSCCRTSRVTPTRTASCPQRDASPRTHSELPEQVGRIAERVTTGIWERGQTNHRCPRSSPVPVL